MNLHTLFVQKTNRASLQFFRYLFVGGLAAVVNIGTLAALKELAGLPMLLANVCAFFAGLAVNFALSKVFIFTAKIPVPGAAEFLLHGAVSGLSLLLDTALLWLFTSAAGWHYLAGKIAATGIGFIWNFAGRKALYAQFDKTRSKGEHYE